ncbi:MAG: sigma-70 family RNA polymerase sigma factor [Tepidisphaeraceae bacterium]
MMIEAEAGDDTELVARCLAGDREGFGRIVQRYQGLICAIAYNACGDVGRSEDLAQETFLAAWRNLDSLKDRTRVKQWLCGIARHIIQESCRRATRDPMAASAPLEESVVDGQESFQAGEQTISKEEQAILWRVLGGLPEVYREPLILFYRQSQSVAEVAEALEVSQDAVKQRLSRGRVMLGERVAKFVETALHGTGPTKAFTLGVLAALPVMTASTKAAVVGAMAAKGSAAAKAAGLIGLANAVLSPVIGFLSLYVGYTLDRDSARSPQRREFAIKGHRIMWACIAAFMLAVMILMACWKPLATSRPALFAGLFIGLGAAYVLVVMALNVWMMRRRRSLRQQEIAVNRPVPLLVPVIEYRSKLALLGLPLIHIRIRGGLERGPIKAWIAAGDLAIGVIFALGALAIAPISVGGLSVGLLTLGGFALGLVPFGGFSFGPWAMGGFAVGWQAFGGCAVGWFAALGGVAVAHGFAEGGVAVARHANDTPAQTFFQNSAFFQHALAMTGHAYWVNLVALVPLALWWRNRNKRKQ